MFAAISPTAVLAFIFTGVVLLLYGVRLLSETFQHSTDGLIKRALGQLINNPGAAFGIGVLATTLMQSSSAMSSLLIGLVSADVLPLTAAIIVLLGSNVGSTLAVQLLVLHITDYAPIILGLGCAIALFTYRSSWKRAGRACFAFGLIVLGLTFISTGSQPIASNSVTALLFKDLSDAPLVLLLIGTLLALILSSSAASVGLIVALAAHGVLPVEAALALMLGANVGTTVIALLSATSNGTLVGRRLALIHTGTKLLGALVAFMLLPLLAGLLAHILPDAGVQVAAAHLAFNCLLALLCVPLAGKLATLAERLLPEQKSAEGKVYGPRYLDIKTLSKPAIALGLATHEILHMADVALEMLEGSIQALEEYRNPKLQQNIEALDDQLDELNAAIKGFLTQLDETALTEEQARQEIALLYITADLEAIGDVITRRFMSLAARRWRDHISFSEEGWEDLVGYHRQVLEALQEGLVLLTVHSPALATEFLERTAHLDELKRELHLRHIRRLHQGIPSSRTSSALHLDMLDTLGMILSHATNMAYVMQEARAVK
ncbi:Na/Pi cotransporter family protein [Ktedonosporobacter rubrisoli]|uniref:Na/Pi cotransporter family protein n=2 Tax=Ktedonosporobacter rubrisoli TaxID=2509675 RepID=A0A4P6K609_KTERU|nr:Na/Pi cotransporter family protein [Ktedonosporobacter rubrisoli]